MAEDAKSAPLEGGSYEVIRRRLLEQASELAGKAERLDARRKEVFGGAELALIANERVRTDNNCIPRDVVSVAGHLLFGFDVFLGLRAETNPEDVLGFHRFDKTDDGYDLSATSHEGPGAFLSVPAFVKELKDTFRYMQGAKLTQLRLTDTRLLLSLRIGDGPRDLKVFRWSIDAQRRLTYVDARGDEDNVPPRSHDFEWVPTTRENQVPGPHPHFNVLDTVFVETINGDMTVKIEDNTTVGQGIYREPVDDPNQTLDDADISYARVGSLILLKIRPFREEAYRYLVYNTKKKDVVRIDAIGLSCRTLPEGHGIVFPGGVFLDSGEHKVFEGDIDQMAFELERKSPNGEDVLYVFHRRSDGQYLLLPYNSIRRAPDAPIRCNGYSLFADGTMAILKASTEPTRVHPIQVWRTPFMAAEFAASKKTDGSYLAKVGNADLVRGISDALSLKRVVSTEKPTRDTYEDVVRQIGKMRDAYFWLGHADAEELLATLVTMQKTSELVIDEFEKIREIQARAEEAVAAAAAAQATLIKELRPDDLKDVDGFLVALTSLRRARGHLISLKDQRGMDLSKVVALETALVAHEGEVNRACVAFLLKDEAFSGLLKRLETVIVQVEAVIKVSDLTAFGADLDTVQGGLTVLGEIVAGLSVDDATERTRILEGVSQAFGQLNRARATFDAKKRELSQKEGKAEFAVQFKLFAQAVTGAIAVCDTPEKCDTELGKLLLSLEELEGRFGQFDEFLGDLADKRQEVQDAIGSRRQLLQDERQRRAQNIAQAAERVIAGIEKKARTLPSPDDLNAYFAADPLVQKVGDFEKQLFALGDTVRADGLASRLKSAKQNALRALRDKADLSGGADDLIRFGSHAFNVNVQPLELTLLQREGAMAFHLTGTDYFGAVTNEELEQTRDLWDQALPSEAPDVYRGEYLAVTMLRAAEENKGGLSTDALKNAQRSGTLLDAVRAFSEDRLDEGYERGVHDSDAARILDRVLSLKDTVGLLRFAPDARARACLYFSELSPDASAHLTRRSRAATRLRTDLGSPFGVRELASDLEPAVAAFLEKYELPASGALLRACCIYLVEEAGSSELRFVTSKSADELREALLKELEERGAARAFTDDLDALRGTVDAVFVARSYVEGFATAFPRPDWARFTLEAAIALATDGKIDRQVSSAVTRAEVTELLGQHPRIDNRKLVLEFDELLFRTDAFANERAVRYRVYRKLRQTLLADERRRLRLDEFMPRVLTSFVRNRLIDEVYLPLVGANLAKQLGAAGDKKRTDLMGMLLLISPPGYGKTTLMEYVASKLGLVFMKVNGPSLGHEVTSLDPAEAKNATARQEVEKINLAFEMGQNVMLYLDDIQHTNTELLQKFISLCDAQRRVEGVWNGKSRTYDLRGKKFCVVMAGNPYTESGSRFQIPDMLANRADTYNLGDVLDGKGDVFALSYLENALTSNSVTAPLAGREPKDVHKLLAKARGEDVALTDLSHGYSAAEVEEISMVFARMLAAQRTLLRVNQEYIASASQADAFRAEPPFKLQGSYRNMNKIAEKIVSAMNDEELERLLDDHYAGESQTLTTGAEQNLLKLKEMRGRLSEREAERWSTIKDEFARQKRSGSAGDDPVTRITSTLSGLDAELRGIREVLGRSGSSDALGAPLKELSSALLALGRPKFDVSIAPQSAHGTDAALRDLGLIERALLPLTEAVAKSSMAQGHASGVGTPDVLFRLDELAALIRKVEAKMKQSLVPPPHFDVTLDGASDSNLYLGLEGNDVIAHGGVYVATYEKLPSLGALVHVTLTFPGGARTEVTGHVAWLQNFDTDDSVASGFGVRITDVDDTGKLYLSEFVKSRTPMVRE